MRSVMLTEYEKNYCSQRRDKRSICGLSRMNVKLKQPPLLNRLFNMSNIVSNMGIIIKKNAREEGYRVTVYDNKQSCSPIGNGDEEMAAC